MLIKDIHELTAITINVEAQELQDCFIAEDQKVAIYRIVQEQMNNVIKYAQASAVTIGMANKGDKIKLSVSDNGIGFDTTVRRKGIGLYNIASRAELFGGRAEVRSSPGNGCALEVELNVKTNRLETTV